MQRYTIKRTRGALYYAGDQERVENVWTENPSLSTLFNTFDAAELLRVVLQAAFNESCRIQQMLVRNVYESE